MWARASSDSLNKRPGAITQSITVLNLYLLTCSILQGVSRVAGSSVVEAVPRAWCVRLPCRPLNPSVL